MRERMTLSAGLSGFAAAALFSGSVEAQPGLPFVEPFDDAALSDASQTTADWAGTVSGELRLPSAEPLMNVFGPATAAEDIAGVHTTRALVLADMDGDGDLDLVEGASGTSGVYLNDGLGGFAARSALGSDAANTRGIAVGDLDADGDLDVVAGNFNGVPSRLYLNAGDGTTFAQFDISSEVRRTDYVVLIDVDNDGLLDVVTANHAPQRNRIYLNTGDPLAPFGAAGVAGADLSTAPDYTQAILAADLDNDGDVDLVSLNQDEVNRVHLNNGAGSFSSADIGAEADDTQDGALGDLNGDGLLDLVVANNSAGQTSKIYINNGTGAPFDGVAAVEFTAVNDPDYAHSVVLGDADNDGDLDIFLSTAGGVVPPTFGNRLYVNDGTGVFSTYSEIGAVSDLTNVGAVGDIDGDDDLDFVAGNEGRDAGGVAFGVANRLFRNAGTSAGGLPVLQLDAVATSLRVDAEATPIASVRLGAAPDSLGAHNDADFWVSSNGGANWVHLVPGGRPVAFPAATQGADLRWRAWLSSRSPGVTAGAAALALDSVTLELNASGPAVVTPIGDQSASEGAAFSVTAAFADADGDQLFHSLSGAPAGTGLKIDVATGEISGTPSNEDVAAAPIALIAMATDGALRAEDAFTLTVAGINDPPVFTSTPVTDAVEGAAYSYAVVATDPDPADVLTIVAAAALPSWLALTDNGDGSATLAGTPAAGDAGDHAVSLEVSDAIGSTAMQDFTVIVAPGGANSPPTFTSMAPTAATEGTEYLYDISASDADGDTVTITATTLPPWLALTDNGDGTAELRGTPAGADLGDHAVELQVEDSSAATGAQPFAITVTAAGEGPTIALNGDADMTVQQGSMFSDPGATASDPQDGDLTAMIVVDNPVDTSVADTYTVTYTVEDSVGNSAQAQRTVVVQQPVGGQGGGDGGGDGGGGGTAPWELFVVALLAAARYTRRSHIPAARPMQRST